MRRPGLRHPAWAMTLSRWPAWVRATYAHLCTQYSHDGFVKSSHTTDIPLKVGTRPNQYVKLQTTPSVCTAAEPGCFGVGDLVKQRPLRCWVDRLERETTIWQCANPSKLGRARESQAYKQVSLGCTCLFRWPLGTQPVQQLQAGLGLDIQLKCPRHCPTLHQARPEPRTRTSRLHIPGDHQFLQNLCRTDCPPGTCIQCKPCHNARPMSLSHAIHLLLAHDEVHVTNANTS